MTTKDYITNFETTLNGTIEDPIDIGVIFQSSLPIGSLIMFGGSVLPDNWIWCDGNEYSTTGTYQKLYQVIGITYGGDGNNFKVPNLQSRFPIGALNPTNRQVNVNGVAITSGGNSVMTLNQMVNHSHTWTSGYSGFVEWMTNYGNKVETGNNGLNISFDQNLSTGNINSYGNQSELYPPFCAVNYIIKFN